MLCVCGGGGGLFRGHRGRGCMDGWAIGRLFHYIGGRRGEWAVRPNQAPIVTASGTPLCGHFVFPPVLGHRLEACVGGGFGTRPWLWFGEWGGGHNGSGLLHHNLLQSRLPHGLHCSQFNLPHHCSLCLLPKCSMAGVEGQGPFLPAALYQVSSGEGGGGVARRDLFGPSLRP